MQQSMWQPDILQVAESLAADVKRMQGLNLMLGRTPGQPGRLERCPLLFLCCDDDIMMDCIFSQPGHLEHMQFSTYDFC